MKHLKALSLALVAVFAMGAVVASAAQANTNQYMTADGNNAFIKGVQLNSSHVFTITGQTVTCTTATFETATEIASPTHTITIHPTYNNCTAFGFVKATVTTTGCNYVFTAAKLTTTENEKKEKLKVTYDNSVEIECTSPNVIKIAVGGCEVTVAGGQSFASENETTNTGSGTTADVDLTTNISSIAATVTKSVFPCTLKVSKVAGEDTSTYTGTTTITGEHNKAQEGVTVEGNDET